MSTLIHNQNVEDDIKSDYEKTREVLYELLERGRMAIHQAEACASTARDFEVLFKGIQEVSNVAAALLDNSQKKIKIDQENKKENKIKAIDGQVSFSGSTSQLQRRISEKKKNIEKKKREEEEAEDATIVSESTGKDKKASDCKA